MNGEPRQVSHSGAHVRDDPGDPRRTTRRSATRPATSSRPAPCPASPGFSPDAASLYLKPGDVMEAEIERIGVLRNPVDLVAGGARRAGAAARALVSWPRDDAKLERVRALMAEQELDALVVRAPDNVLYLTNFWGMKGYDACVFPREGEPVLICLEPSRRGRGAHGLDERRPPLRGLRRRATRGRRARARSSSRRGGRERTGASASSSRSARRRPTAWSASRRPSRRPGSTRGRTPSTRRRCSPRRARSRPTQEIERMRLANEIAAAAMEHVAGRDPARDDGGAGGGEWQGFVHGEGTGWKGQVELALGFSLVWSGAGIKTFTATGDRPGRRETSRRCSRSGSAPTATGPTTRRTSAPGELTPRYDELLEALHRRLRRRGRVLPPGREPGRPRPAGSARASPRPAIPGQPSHPICHGVGARAHEPPYAHQAGGGDDRARDGARDRARDLLGRRRRPARRGQFPDHGRRRREALPVPRRSRRLLTRVAADDQQPPSAFFTDGCPTRRGALRLPWSAALPRSRPSSSSRFGTCRSCC